MISLALSKARQNFADPSIFTYEDFSYKVVRIFFDQLHGVKTNEISLIDALELMVFCNHLGQIDQKSIFETRLYDELCKKITGEIKDPKQISLIWLFLRSWGPSGRDLIGKPSRSIVWTPYHIDHTIWLQVVTFE